LPITLALAERRHAADNGLRTSRIRKHFAPFQMWKISAGPGMKKWNC
jgi:hypothetical protein